MKRIASTAIARMVWPWGNPPGQSDAAESRLDGRFRKVRDGAKQALAYGERRKGSRDPHAERAENEAAGNRKQASKARLKGGRGFKRKADHNEEYDFGKYPNLGKL